MDSSGVYNDRNSARGPNKTIPPEDSSEGEEQEVVDSNPNEDELQHFRERWQKELKISPAKGKKPKNIFKIVNKREDDDTADHENKARSLFLKGVDMEKSGKLYEAIQFYRKAIQLVPDIEFKIHNLTRSSRATHSSEGFEKKIETATPKELSSESDTDNVMEGDLLSKIQKKTSSSPICMAKFEQKSIHISALPVEIMLYILRWVVSSELDLRSMEMFGEVCRGFYLCARDAEIWKLACLKVWSVQCGKTPGSFSSWRSMFIDRARLRFNGCYISKTTYIRHGENSFQDQFYRPWHFVAYYRYFRFFPEGIVLMLTSADEPAQCVAQLRQRNPRSPVLSGYYRLKDDKVTLVVHRQENPVLSNFKRHRRRELLDSSEQSFHMELQIMNHRHKRHVQLQWTHYSVRTKTRRGDENVCIFDLVNNKYPPLWFSRVKSYTIESENPLV